MRFYPLAPLPVCFLLFDRWHSMTRFLILVVKDFLPLFVHLFGRVSFCGPADLELTDPPTCLLSTRIKVVYHYTWTDPFLDH